MSSRRFEPRWDIEQFDLLTVSYGTAIAEAYLRWHPERVRRAVLDAPIGLGVPWADRVDAVGSLSAILADEMAAACETDRCAAVLEGVAADQTYETLRAAVLAAEPSVGSGNLRLTPVMLDQATLLALHSEDHWHGWASAIDEALAGDGSLLWNAGERTYLDVDRQVYYRSLCADIDRPSDASGYAGGQDPLLFTYASELTPCELPDRCAAAAPCGRGRASPRHPDICLDAGPTRAGADADWRTVPIGAWSLLRQQPHRSHELRKRRVPPINADLLGVVGAKGFEPSTS